MKITYIIHHGYAERLSVKDTERDLLTIEFKGEDLGAVTLGKTVLSLHRGEASIRISALPDGEYLPRLESAGGVFTAEGFTKSGSRISVNETDDFVIRRLIDRCRHLELTLQSLEEKVTAIEEAYRGHDIFNFERKEK